MFEKLKDNVFRFFTSRLTLLTVVFCIMTVVLIYRCFVLQIVHGKEYLDKFILQTEKSRDISAARGSIYDCNGVLLAYDDLAYSVRIEDVYDENSNSAKNKSLNETIYKMINMIEKCGDHIIYDFPIQLNDMGYYEFTLTGSRLMRFKADVYGRTTLDKMTPEEQLANPDDIIAYLCGPKKFAIGQYAEAGNTKSDFIVGKGYTRQELLKVLNIRYSMHLTRYTKYIGTTVAKDVNSRTIAAIMENSNELNGVSIVEDTVRRYNNSMYFAHILGYTGKIDSDELDRLNQEDLEMGGTGERYTISDVIGKSGIEAYMESTLQGSKGYEKICVDNMGKVVSVLEHSDAAAGNDVYLTIDSDLQIATYKILEQHIAGILAEKIIDARDYHAPNTGGDIKIPIYDVYYAVINNSVIDINHFNHPDAGETETTVYEKYLDYSEKVYNRIYEELSSKKTVYNKLNLEYQVYESFIVSQLQKEGIINTELVNKEDPTHIAWTIDETISLNEYLRYCINQNWIEISSLSLEGQYSDTSEIYNKVLEYIEDMLRRNTEFQKRIYRFMIKSDVISGKQICKLLWEQQAVNISDEDLDKLYSGNISAYRFMMNRIVNLDITPAQLALDPCNGSAVITNVNGQVLALVTYPGYDNNKMANSVDPEYFNKLLNDKANPLINYATQYKAAPGSTFKMVSATAGLCENIIKLSSTIKCTGNYTKVTPSPWCWKHSGHGELNVTGAIQNSCNFFFYDVGYQLSCINGSYDASTGLETLAKYADLYGLTEKSGIEIDEYKPDVSNELPIPSAIGQGTNSYTTVGLSRYITTIANNGYCYNLTLLNKVTDKEGNLLESFSPTLRNTVDIPYEYWNAIHMGMKKVVEGKTYLRELGVHLAGKTGTAQQVKSRPNHALFVCYAPYESPEISITVRIPFGYSSDYAAQTTKDIVSYYFKLDDQQELINGKADAPESGVSHNEI